MSELVPCLSCRTTAWIGLTPSVDTGLIDLRRINAVEAIRSAVERQVVGVSRAS
jgi:hypothetical protein